MAKTNPHELRAILDLDGTEIELMDGQFFAKFEVRNVEPSPEVPHGIKYSLTLHDRTGQRILGSTMPTRSRSKKAVSSSARSRPITGTMAPAKQSGNTGFKAPENCLKISGQK